MVTGVLAVALAVACCALAWRQGEEQGYRRAAKWMEEQRQHEPLEAAGENHAARLLREWLYGGGPNE